LAGPSCRRAADALDGRRINAELSSDLPHSRAPWLTQRCPVWHIPWPGVADRSMLRRTFPNDLDGSGFECLKIVSRSPLGLGSGKECNIAAAAIIGMVYLPFTIARLILDHGLLGIRRPADSCYAGP